MKMQLKQKIAQWTVAGLAFIRWLIFIPAGLVAGGMTFFMVMGLVDNLTAQSRPGARPGAGDKEFLSSWGISAELISGFLSVLVGMLVAPRGKRIIAVAILAAACVIMTGILTGMAQDVDGPNVRIYPVVGWMIYSASVVITSIVMWRQDKAKSGHDIN